MASGEMSAAEFTDFLAQLFAQHRRCRAMVHCTTFSLNIPGHDLRLVRRPLTRHIVSSRPNPRSCSLTPASRSASQASAWLLATTGLPMSRSS
jgi:hypothetical protein